MKNAFEAAAKIGLGIVIAAAAISSIFWIGDPDKAFASGQRVRRDADETVWIVDDIRDGNIPVLLLRNPETDQEIWIGADRVRRVTPAE